MRRRPFLCQLGGCVVTSLVHPALSVFPDKKGVFLDPDHPKAIAMWDFSWLLRQYPGGGFEDWDKALDELVERGYNAIRIDCFPQFIGRNEEGLALEKYHLPKRNWRPSIWGNEITIDIRPRTALLEFLIKCRDHNIAVVLSSWFYGHGTERHHEFLGTSGLIRAWDDVLHLLKDHKLLDLVLYIDLLNEYPLWHGYAWLSNQLEQMRSTKSRALDFLNDQKQNRYTASQANYYNEFINEVILSLKRKWPQILFTASQTNTLNTPWQDQDIQNFDVLDIHLWMIYNKPFSEYSGYFEHIHRLRNDTQFGPTQRRMTNYWNEHKEKLTDWLENGIEERSNWARDNNIPLGNTEGWGAVIWMDHPALNWNFIKETGRIAAELGVKHGYSFNCTSNFTHPHFDLWKDVSWHQEVTQIIRKL